MARRRPPTFGQDLHDVLAGPLIHRLAQDLADDFPRRRRHPVAMHLGYLALQRAIGSANRLDAELASPGAWARAVDAYNLGAHRHGDGRTIGAALPPPTADTFRHLRERLTADERLEPFLAALSDRSIVLATDVGLLPAAGGSLTHPIASRTMYGDGTIVRPLYRPDTPGRTDPETAEHFRHDGGHWGNNMVLAYCRGTQPHQRIILGVARTDQPGREAQTATELFTRIALAANGRIQAIVYDGAFRGVHHNTLMRQLGVVVITKVHAAARRDGDRIVRTIPLGNRRHTPRGHPCDHTLVINDGAIHEAAIDAVGELVLSQPLQRHQVRRTHSARNGYRFNLGVTVPCPAGEFIAWASVHPHADQLRLLPESDPDFAALYGLRNDAESNNNSYKRTLPGRRAAALGWRRQLLDVAGWAILINSRAHARYGPQPLDNVAPPRPKTIDAVIAEHQTPNAQESPPAANCHHALLRNVSRRALKRAIR